MNNKMKLWVMGAGLVAGLGLLIWLMTGCSMFGAEPKAPAAWEQKLFNITTNVTERIVVKTNWVTVTNEAVQTVTRTNEVNQVVPVSVTNYTTVAVPLVVRVTNEVPTYDYKPSETGKAVTGTAGNISNLVVPGSGVLVSGLGAMLLGVWARLRSTKRMAGVLAQGIEVYGETVKAVQAGTGKDIDAEVKAWLQKHQAENAVLQQTLGLLDRVVDNEAARQTAQDLRRFIQERSGAAPVSG